MVAPYAWAFSLAGCRAADKKISLNKKGPTSGPFFTAIGYVDSDLFEDQRTVSTAKAEGVTQGVLHSTHLARFVRNEVQIATFIRVIQVDGWRNSLVAQRKNRVNRLYCSRCTQQVTGHGFCGADQYAAGRFTEDRLNSLSFCFIARRGRGTVCVNVADLRWGNTRIANRVFHGQRGARTIFWR